MSAPRTSGTYVPPPARGDCPSGKVQFATRKQARRGARFRAIKGVGVYRCDECSWWHLGHLPDRVRNGEVDKAAWIRSKGSNA
jgi:hypothetical protein